MGSQEQKRLLEKQGLIPGLSKVEAELLEEHVLNKAAEEA
jgi:hypothetical protein